MRRSGRRTVQQGTQIRLTAGLCRRHCRFRLFCGGAVPLHQHTLGRKQHHAQQQHLQCGTAIRCILQVAAPSQGHVVIQLNLFRSECGRQLLLGLVITAGHRLAHRQLVKLADQFIQQGQLAGTMLADRRQRLQHTTGLLLRQRHQQRQDVVAVHRTQHGVHRLAAELLTAEGDRLIRQAQCIPHGTLSRFTQ